MKFEVEAAAPEWFLGYLATEPDERRVDVDGATIHYLQWGDPTAAPGIVFVHGGAAHAHWWSHIAPAFLPRSSAVAIDLSGHGDSDRRDVYSLTTWATDAAAVIADAAFGQRPVVVGHSMGGFVSVATAAGHPAAVDGLVIVDSPIREVDSSIPVTQAASQFARAKVFDDPETAVRRFRVVPEQELILPFVGEAVARRSLRQVEGGWTWKFDTAITIPRRAEAEALLPQVACRSALLRSEHGLVTEDVGEHMYNALGRVSAVIELPTAGHHPMLDVPLILITALRSLLADWDHSIPGRAQSS